MVFLSDEAALVSLAPGRTGSKRVRWGKRASTKSFLTLESVGGSGRREWAASSRHGEEDGRRRAESLRERAAILGLGAQGLLPTRPHTCTEAERAWNECAQGPASTPAFQTPRPGIRWHPAGPLP